MPQADLDVRVPDDIARMAVLPESYRDEEAVHRAYAWLRENLPVGRAEVEGFDPVWLISRHHDVVEVERAPGVFPVGDHNQIFRNQASDRFQRDVLGGGNIRVLDSLSAMDAPEHGKVRSVANHWFMPTRIRVLEEGMRRDAKEAADRLVDHDGELDFVEFARLYPLRVIMTLLGVPREDEPLMLKLTQDFFGTREPASPGAAPVADPASIAKQWHSAIAGFLDYFHALADERRKAPRDDFLSLIANAEVDGAPLEPRYQAAFCVSIAAAGHDTTSSSITAGLLGLIRDPDQLAQVSADPTLVPGLVDESMRWATPVKHFMRSATEGAVVGGQPIGQGERLMLLYGSANRDADVFESPDDFDVTRHPNKHLSFGTGPHMCLGLHVAKSEMRILWQELLPRITSVELAGQPQYVASNWVGGLKTLPVRITTS